MENVNKMQASSLPVSITLPLSNTDESQWENDERAKERSYISKWNTLFVKNLSQWMSVKPKEGASVYPCYSCKDLFSSKNSFLTHINRRGMQINYKCPKCSVTEELTFYNPCSFLLHCREHFAGDFGYFDLENVVISMVPLGLAGFFEHPNIPQLFSEPAASNVKATDEINSRFYNPTPDSEGKRIICMKSTKFVFFQTAPGEKFRLMLKQQLTGIPLCVFVKDVDDIVEKQLGEIYQKQADNQGLRRISLGPPINVSTGNNAQEIKGLALTSGSNVVGVAIQSGANIVAIPISQASSVLNMGQLNSVPLTNGNSFPLSTGCSVSGLLLSGTNVSSTSFAMGGIAAGSNVTGSNNTPTSASNITGIFITNGSNNNVPLTSGNNISGILLSNGNNGSGNNVSLMSFPQITKGSVNDNVNTIKSNATNSNTLEININTTGNKTVTTTTKTLEINSVLTSNRKRNKSVSSGNYVLSTSTLKNKPVSGKNTIDTAENINVITSENGDNNKNNDSSTSNAAKNMIFRFNGKDIPLTVKINKNAGPNTSASTIQYINTSAINNTGVITVSTDGESKNNPSSIFNGRSVLGIYDSAGKNIMGAANSNDVNLMQLTNNGAFTIQDTDGNVLGSLMPNGNVVSGSLMSNGGSLTNNGNVVSGSLMNNGNVVSGSLMNNGNVVSGSLMNNVNVVSGSLMSNGNIVSGSLMNNGNVVLGSLMNDVNVVSGSLMLDGNVVENTTGMSGKDVTAPSDDTVAPRNHITSPRNDITSPRNDITSPRNDITSPRNDITSPRNDITSPRNDITSPRNDIMAPSNDQATPNNDITTASIAITAPSNDITSLKNDITAPKNDITAPSNDTAAPNITENASNVISSNENILGIRIDKVFSTKNTKNGAENFEQLLIKEEPMDLDDESWNNSNNVYVNVKTLQDKIQKAIHKPPEAGKAPQAPIPSTENTYLCEETGQLKPLAQAPPSFHLQNHTDEEIKKVLVDAIKNISKQSAEGNSGLAVPKEEPPEIDEDILNPVCQLDENFMDEPINPLWQRPNCIECNCENVDNMMDHFKGDDLPTDDGLKCRHCLYIAATPCSLKSHERLHVVSSPYVCPECGKVMKNYPTLVDHLDFVCFHRAKLVRYRCRVKNCGKNFATYITYAAHFKCHILEMLRCEKCHMDVFDAKYFESLFDGHNCDDNAIKVYKCQICKKELSVDTYPDHLNRHAYDCGSRVYIYMCKYCKNKNKSLSNYAYHLKYCMRKHEIQTHPKPSVKPPNKQAFICVNGNQVGQVKSNTQDLVKMLNNLVTKNPKSPDAKKAMMKVSCVFKCRFCNFIFQTRLSYNQHIQKCKKVPPGLSAVKNQNQSVAIIKKSTELIVRCVLCQESHPVSKMREHLSNGCKERNSQRRITDEEDPLKITELDQQMMDRSDSPKFSNDYPTIRVVNENKLKDPLTSFVDPLMVTSEDLQQLTNEDGKIESDHSYVMNTPLSKYVRQYKVKVTSDVEKIKITDSMKQAINEVKQHQNIRIKILNDENKEKPIILNHMLEKGQESATQITLNEKLMKVYTKKIRDLSAENVLLAKENAGDIKTEVDDEDSDFEMEPLCIDNSGNSGNERDSDESANTAKRPKITEIKSHKSVPSPISVKDSVTSLTSESSEGPLLVPNPLSIENKEIELQRDADVEDPINDLNQNIGKSQPIKAVVVKYVKTPNAEAETEDCLGFSKDELKPTYKKAENHTEQVLQRFKTKHFKKYSLKRKFTINITHDVPKVKKYRSKSLDASPISSISLSPMKSESEHKKKRRRAFTPQKPKKPDLFDSSDLMPDEPVVFNGTYHCKLCGATETDRAVFQKHLTEHRTSSPCFQCMECGECFIVKPSLIKHLCFIHKITDVDNYFMENDCFDTAENDQDVVGENQCRICKEQFTDPLELSKHFRVHGMAFLMNNSK